jgi:hypothetical protein
MNVKVTIFNITDGKCFSAKQNSRTNLVTHFLVFCARRVKCRHSKEIYVCSLSSMELLKEFWWKFVRWAGSNNLRTILISVRIVQKSEQRVKLIFTDLLENTSLYKSLLALYKMNSIRLTSLRYATLILNVFHIVGLLWEIQGKMFPTCYSVTFIL